MAKSVAASQSGGKAVSPASNASYKLSPSNSNNTSRCWLATKLANAVVPRSGSSRPGNWYGLERKSAATTNANISIQFKSMRPDECCHTCSHGSCTGPTNSVEPVWTVDDYPVLGLTRDVR